MPTNPPTLDPAPHPRYPVRPMAKKPKVNALILGSGGREHALGYKLKQSKRCGKLYFAPGNGGTAELGTNLSDLPFDPVNTKPTGQPVGFYLNTRSGVFVRRRAEVLTLSVLLNGD